MYQYGKSILWKQIFFFLISVKKIHHRVIELMDNGAPETIDGVTMSPTTMASNTKTTLCEDA